MNNKHNSAKAFQEKLSDVAPIFGKTLANHNLASSIIVTLLMISAISGANAATFTVANTNDSGTGSLRQAMFSANANTQSDTINFSIPISDPNCAAGVCTLKLTSGELTVSSVNPLITTANNATSQIAVFGFNHPIRPNVPLFEKFRLL